MIRLHFICEGQSEERFATELLAPHLLTKNIHLLPSLLGKVGQKGGNVSYARLLNDIGNRLKTEPNAYCTTFFDFYGLPSDFPNKTTAQKLPLIADKSKILCEGLAKKLEADLGANITRRFIPYVQMYEFEALLFSDPSKFATGIDKDALIPEFQKIRQAFASPEEINDSAITAPSKRILKLAEDYEKPLHGILAALEIGLDTIRQECRLFNAWLNQIEHLNPIG